MGKQLKYRNIITEVDGIRFDSKLEAKQYGILKMRKLAGEIDSFHCQVKFLLEINQVTICTYIADFVTYKADKIPFEVIDCKGVKTAVYQLKKKLMKAIRGIDIIEIK